MFSMLFLTLFIAQTQAAEAAGTNARIYWTSVDPNYKWDTFDTTNEFKYRLRYYDSGGHLNYEWGEGGQYQIRYYYGKTSVPSANSLTTTDYTVDAGTKIEITFYDQDYTGNQVVTPVWMDMYVPSGSVPNLYTWTGTNGDKFWVSVYKS